MQAIETVYRGHRFRSRFEADVALLLDAMSLEWKYEPVSVLLDDGTHYMPDFFVSECRLWIEVRGYESEKGEQQIREFAKHLVRNVPQGTRAPDYIVFRRDRVDFFDGYYGFAWSHHPASMLECGCGRRCFFSMHGFWRCRRCGATGDPHGLGTVWRMEMVGGRVGARSEWGKMVTLAEMVRGMIPTPAPAERSARGPGMESVGDILGSLHGGKSGIGSALRRAGRDERSRSMDSSEGAA